MDVFKVPLVFAPEARKTIQASMAGDKCVIKFPKPWLSRKKYLAIMVDRIYWRLLGKFQAPQLLIKANRLNHFYFGFSFREIRYHRQFRRWGSCSALKNINLSHRLIGAPQDFEDYVILHELAHLKHLNHGKEFWALLASTGLNSQMIRKEINLYGRSWHNTYQQWYQNLLHSI